ncbi:MAG: hypothetical protein Q9227_002585 [Pyrenula ochraceoflavens]
MVMDPRRVKKTSSAGAEPKATTYKSETRERPKLGDHSNSSPSVGRRRQSHSKPQEIITDRTSKGSIRDDPFFRAYQSPQSLRLADRARRANEPHEHESRSPKYGNIPCINLAVLGARGVGKSIFVQRALDLRHQPMSRYSSKKMSLDGVIYLVRLLEVSIEEVTITDNRRVAWPSTISDRDMPSVDGALVLYDVTNPESISDIPPVLQALFASTVPSLLVSCKCDNPPQLRQVAPGIVRQASFALGGIDAQQTSANVPESQKRCISIILRQILARSSEYSRQGGLRSSKARPKVLETQASPNAKALPTTNHSRRRASSEVEPDLNDTPNAERSSSSPASSPSTTKYFDRSQKPPIFRESAKQPTALLGVQASHGVENNGQSLQPETPLTPGDLIIDGPTSPISDHQPETPYSPHSYSLATDPRPTTSDSQGHNTFLDMDDENDLESPVEPRKTHIPEIEHLKISHAPEAVAGHSIEELVDRLLSMPMSKYEARFIPIFLCLYRKFATPAQLLTLVMKKFEGLDRSPEAQLIKVGEQLRYLQVLAQWTSDYPGDFAQPAMKAQIGAFLARMEKSRIFAYAAKELSTNVGKATEDDEAGWPLSDEEDQSSFDPPPITKVLSSASIALTSGSTIAAGRASTDDLLAKTSQKSSQEDISSTHHSTAPSQASSGISRSQPGSSSNPSLATAGQTHDEASREASNLIPIPRRPLCKPIWRRFMEVPDEEFARELTRMDWVMYNSIRPRDLVRHVSLASARRAQKTEAKKSTTLRNVDRMINHFNHLTLFVAAMILFRDKPKHRVMALEKFMSISWKLRQMNNYNSLGALLAGINNSTVTRLAETWALLPRTTSKEFMRLNILMGSAKSHFAYRLAWENSPGERIPFIPLHRRDLVAAEDGNRTNVGPNGDRINWKKFEIMGDVVIGIQKSQEKPYKFGPRNHEVAWLVLETKLLIGDEDSLDPYQELYERSIAVEPPKGGMDPHRRKLNDWFKR